MMRKVQAILIVVLPVAGAAAGYFSGPFLARANDEVQLARRIWEEDSGMLEARTLESEAFRAAGESRAALFANARAIEAQLSLGGAILGAWLGLVAAVKVLLLGGVPKQETYLADSASCLACGRCFLSCPRERLRLKKLLER